MIFTEHIETLSKIEFKDITRFVSASVEKSGVENGLCTIFIPHTTAGVTINENADPDVKTDLVKAFKSLNLDKIRFDHAEGNSPAHMMSTLTGVSLSIIIYNGKLVLGTWQGVYFAEFDGPRNRRVIIKISES